MKIPDILTRQQTLYLLQKYLLDKDCTPNLTLDQVENGYIKPDLIQQVNSDIVSKILYKHSRKYRKQSPHKTEPLNYEQAIGKIMKYLLGDNYYIVDPVSMEQGNSVIVHDILNKYSKRYIKELREESKMDTYFRLFDRTIIIKKKEKRK